MGLNEERFNINYQNEGKEFELKEETTKKIKLLELEVLALESSGDDYHDEIVSLMELIKDTQERVENYRAQIKQIIVLRQNLLTQIKELEKQL